MNMKFMRGMILGTIATAGIIMLYQDNNKMMNKRKMMKKGKQFAKKMGII